MLVEENIPLAPLTTLGVGGPARYFVRAENEIDVSSAFAWAAERRIPVFVLGGGSNIVVADAGFDGLVIQIAMLGKSDTTDDSTLTVAAGEDWDSFVGYCVERNLAGVECLSGIPGFVGGTPVQNVGAYGQEVAETIVSVRCFDRSAGRIVELANAECGFSYRMSIFNSTERDRYAVLSVVFRLTPNGRPKIAYRDLQELFGDRQPSLAEARRAVLDIRRRKSMVIDPSDPNSRSSGSFFKNPIVSGDRLPEIADAAGDEEAPSFSAGDHLVKIPAAWLIERAGFRKGFRLGNAGISENHSLAIVNRGGARAAEIIELKDLIQTKVAEKFSIELVPEPIFVGFE